MYNKIRKTLNLVIFFLLLISPIFVGSASATDTSYNVTFDISPRISSIIIDDIEYFSKEIVGEATVFGKNLFNFLSLKLQRIEKKSKNQKIALIGSGELTVTIKGKGIGGRNQEMLLSFIDDIINKKLNYNFLIMGVNLDGIEGNSKAMGALVDNVLLTHVIEKKINLESFLTNNDSNSFFKTLNTEILTGITGINVNDLLLILINPTS